MPVAAGVVRIAQRATAFTHLNVAAERLGATVLNRAHGTVLHRSQTVRGLIRCAVMREDVGEFYLPLCRTRCSRMRVHAGLRARDCGSREQIER